MNKEAKAILYRVLTLEARKDKLGLYVFQFSEDTLRAILPDNVLKIVMRNADNQKVIPHI